jgi:hypothetical protein
VYSCSSKVELVVWSFLLSSKFLSECWQPKWRKFLAHVGPGALVAIGFLDPSNCKVLLFSHCCIQCIYTCLQEGEQLFVMVVKLVSNV